MMQSRWLVLLGALALPACSVSEKPRPDPNAKFETAESQVNARLQVMSGALASANVDSILGFWAADVRALSPGMVTAGDAQMRETLGTFYGSNKPSAVTITPTETVAHDSGAVVYQFGHYTETLTPKAGGTATTSRNNFAVRWTKDASGSWRMHRFIATPMPGDTVAVPVVAPVRSTGDAQNAAAAISQVNARTAEYEAAISSGDVARVMSFWADDGQVMEPEAHMPGKVAIGPMMEYFFGNYRIEGLHFNTAETFVHDGGNVVYQIGDYGQSLVPKDGKSAPIKTHSNYLTRWRRAVNGTWTIDRFIATPAS